ncbi:M20 family metallo-hydrolase [Komagataeibacter swingsii]|uniref:M20 family metallo-hydrolase n=1 Tax=Komagataeibacter swingsii TaxID=215220 RepID=A0A850P211_9PROT|nr:M20 family metallo-hydrolase [Komagataeibacter swingsii]NVN35732.1 M20 family metallo-hydrolase [Komagataeibacter swingsii]
MNQDMTPTGVNLGIDGPSLLADIAETAAFGGTAKGGICRLALGAADRQVRDWLGAQAAALGAVLTVDSMGNQFIRLPGSDPALPPLVMGSHLDTQPTGGKYDGIYGVLAGLSALRALQRSGYRMRHPVELVNWTNEEGSRFAPAMMSSGVFAGAITQAQAYGTQDAEGTTFGQALEDIGYRGAEPCGQHPVRAYFELHIEQGPVLEREGMTIGAVTGVQAMRWFDLRLSGQEAHAGTTPRAMRHDALLAAAHVMITIDEIAQSYGADMRATVGVIHVQPGSTNVVPGDVRMSLDLRHPDDDVIAAVEEHIRTQSARQAELQGVTFLMNRIWESPAVHFDPDCVELVRRAASLTGQGHRDIVSGAGHDAAYMGHICPTAMIFIPCRDGLSHNEAEHAEPGDIVAGANVLLHAVMAADAHFDAA